MGWNGLERNKLDYILTDLLPVELSELFSFRPFYDFLLEKENSKELSAIVDSMKIEKAKNQTKLFSGGWDTQPLKYLILKGAHGRRQMSLLQPLSALNLYVFIECYQKDILNYFEKESCFSLRYHKKSSQLFYKGKTSSGTDYFQGQLKRNGKLAIQQMGTFFKIGPFQSINAFTGSLKWRMCNFQYSYYAQIDYKSCFDSIYTHAYKWIVERNVIDSKDANHGSLFITIDRILQNVNGKSSNGLIVGPEFSRMIAEILLQHIDKTVNRELLKKGILLRKDFTAYRYVDDIYIFGKSQEIVDEVILTFSTVAQNYLIHLNELKISKGRTPCLPKAWLAETRIVSDQLSDWFYTKEEYHAMPVDKRYLVKTDYIFIDRIKDDISVLIKGYEADQRTIVSFLISTIFNNISRKKDGTILFSPNSCGRALMLLDMALYIYSFCPSYEQTRKIISMIVYINNEIDFKKDAKAKKKLQGLIRRYSFVFVNGNVFDLIDWFAFLFEYEIALEIEVEDVIVERMKILNDPILWANMLIYSRYNKPFFNCIKATIQAVIEEELEKITTKSPMLNREFWYVIIFHNCPYIDSKLIAQLEEKTKFIPWKGGKIPSSEPARKLVYDFLSIKDSNGKKPLDSFFNWSGATGLGSKITYRTYQRTVFKKYNRRSGFYTSLD